MVRGGVLNAESLFPPSPANPAKEPSVKEAEVLLVSNPTVASGEEEEIPSFFAAKADFERGYWMRVLQVAKGNIARAARIASKSRTEVYSLLKKHGLDPTSYK
jgi:DNA-binding NtrC family response regulator